MNDHAAGVDAKSTAKRVDLLRRAENLTRGVADLKTLAIAFERWHEDMIFMTAQSRGMSVMGEDLARIARGMIMVSINAAIEAARAGDIARGFVVVAAEVKTQAQHVQALSGDMRKTLHKGELMTTATFQDIQAGGKMMMAAISGLELMVNQLRSELG
ncbi:MAG: methyl-accepting chemotaxis protein [Steroidobacteraceae bacterium]